MSPEALAGIVGGLVLLVLGGEVLVRGAGNIALAAGLSPLVVGLTVVSSATSAPEFAVTMDAVLADLPGLAIGDLVGSNIANILLVLGTTAALATVVVDRQLLRFDVPILIGISVLATFFAFGGAVQRWQGGVLFLALLVYLVAAFRTRERVPSEPAELTLGPVDVSRWPQSRVVAASVVLVVFGVGLLVVGAGVLVAGAESIAVSLGISDVVIGITVVAVGTSLPELATSVVAVRRGKTDLAVGNVVGSCIFNLGGVLGLAAMLVPGGIPVAPGAAYFDFFVMTGVALLLLPVAYVRSRISRIEGALFLIGYLVYMLFLLLRTQEHDALQPFSYLVVLVLVPVIVIVLVIQVIAEWRYRARHPHRDTVATEQD